MKVNPISSCFRFNAARAEDIREDEETGRIICSIIAAAVLAFIISSVVYLLPFQFETNFIFWWIIFLYSFLICVILILIIMP